MTDIEDVSRNGFCILPDAFDAGVVTEMRQVVMANTGLMANTRPNPASRHMAGFHRIGALEPLHRTLAENPALLAALTRAFSSSGFSPIGLSDITVNRSQPWHTDLLRGAYARFLTPEMCWGPDGGGCLKALLYLQDGKGLRVVPGSHIKPAPLDDDAARDRAGDSAVALDVRAGDIVLMDIRLIHRGATEDAMRDPALRKTPKILVSTVFGAADAPLTHAMREGNAQRMRDWDARHLPGHIAAE